MHIVLGMLGSIVTVLWLLHRLAEMGIDLGGLNPWLWRRRRKWRQKFEANPIFSVDSPMEATALLVTAAAKADGDMTANEKKYYDYMLTYSPYDQVKAKAYPHLLVSTGLWDPAVQYWEPAKWVAKLRASKTDDNRLLLFTDMDAGHSGQPGRFESLKETAREFAFIFDTIGIE